MPATLPPPDLADAGAVPLRQRGRRVVVRAADVAFRLASPALFAHGARLARRRGVTEPLAVVSFDCDTDRDIEVVHDVHARLAAIGIKPAYAVPGTQLERGSSVYRRLADDGAEFLNHGYAEHCRLDPATRTYHSSHFYDRLSAAQVEDDVRRGHDAHIRVLGRAPIGFRTPHFGSFQRPSQLRSLHRLLSSMGYRYSTSTTPLYGLLGGPVISSMSSLVEIPVSGRLDAPHRVLDSWSFRFAPGRRVSPADYERQLAALVDRWRAAGTGVVNVYADPSQVVDWPGFFTAVERLAPFAVPSYLALLDRLGL